MYDFKDIKNTNNTKLNDKIQYIIQLVKDGVMDADQAIHEIKELRDIYGA